MSAGKSFQMSMAGAIVKDTDAKDLKFRTKDDWVNIVVTKRAVTAFSCFLMFKGVSAP